MRTTHDFGATAASKAKLARVKAGSGTRGRSRLKTFLFQIRSAPHAARENLLDKTHVDVLQIGILEISKPSPGIGEHRTPLLRPRLDRTGEGILQGARVFWLHRFATDRLPYQLFGVGAEWPECGSKGVVVCESPLKMWVCGCGRCCRNIWRSERQSQKVEKCVNEL